MQQLSSQSDIPAQPSDLIPEIEQEPVVADTENFTVCVRVRPLHPRELNKKNPKKQTNIIKTQDNMVIVLDPDISSAESSYRRDKMYVFDNVFDDSNDTESVFRQSMLPLLDNVLNGYNATLFAYGMTGAGKTHTLFGEINPETLVIERSGLIFLTLEELFRKIRSSTFTDYEFSVKISYLEIYNEQVRDLLTNAEENLMILEDPQKGVFVADLTETSVASQNEVMQLVRAGNSKRIMASTAANTFSSRSHAIVQVLIERKEKTAGVKGTVLQSKLSLIDLAGSERAAATENRGLRMLEGANINRSLLALGNCINILSDTNKKGAFVPYRDSKLTRLLKDSLGGNTKTIMIACISPSYLCYEETINTLKYASRAKNIKRKITQNVKEVELHVSQYKEIIESLKAEIESLKGQLKEKVHEGSVIISQRVKDTQLDGVVKDLEASEILEGEKKIEEASHKIMENLEQNWEISQTLRELSELEQQNKTTLQNLYQHLDKVSEEDKVYREQILRQIETLKGTMENNEKTKNEIVSTLQGNLLENRNLKDQLVEFASSVDTLEDIELAKKLLHIDKLDIVTQNTQIKKEALNLAKAKIQQNKQISQMEEEMRQMRAMLQEKERLIASNTQLIQTLQTQISEQSSFKSSVENLRTPNQLVQGLETLNGPEKEEKLEEKTSVLKNLLQNLEKKISKSIHDLDSKRGAYFEHETDDLEVLEALKTLDSRGDTHRKVEDYSNNIRSQISQNKPIVPKNYEESDLVMIDENTSRILKKEPHFMDSYRGVEKRGMRNNIVTDSLTSFQEQSTTRTPSEILQKINMYDMGGISSQRSRIIGINEHIVPSSNLSSQDSRLKLAVKGLSTGALENISKGLGSFKDIDNQANIKNTESYEGYEDLVCLETLDHIGSYQSIDPIVSSSQDIHIPQINPRKRDQNLRVIDSNNNSTREDKDIADWNLRRQSFQHLMKDKVREQSLGNIRGSFAHPNSRVKAPELNRHSNSILGLYRDKFFESMLGPEAGNESVNNEKRGGLEIRSLGQERENLKIFRNRLNVLASVNVTKLTKDLVDQIKELIEENQTKKYILSVKDQDLLKMLGEAVMQYESKHPHEQGPIELKPKRVASVKEENKKPRSSSVRGSQNVIPVSYKEIKRRSNNQSRERKLSTQAKPNENEVPSKRNSVKNTNTMGQGVLSNIHSNYTQTINKLMLPNYTGKPEAAGKSKGNQSNPQTPIEKKNTKEKENNAMGTKNLAANIMTILSNQPKYISKKEASRRSRSRFNEGDQVNV